LLAKDSDKWSRLVVKISSYKEKSFIKYFRGLNYCDASREKNELLVFKKFLNNFAPSLFGGERERELKKQTIFFVRRFQNLKTFKWMKNDSRLCIFTASNFEPFLNDESF
jgi:hypothetical protein